MNINLSSIWPFTDIGRLTAILLCSCMLITPAPALQNPLPQNQALQNLSAQNQMQVDQGVSRQGNTNQQLTEMLRNMGDNPDLIYQNPNFQGGNQGFPGAQPDTQGFAAANQDRRQDFIANFYPDPLTGKLMVVTSDRNAEMISNLLPEISRPSPQVLIKVLFLEVTYNKGLDMGIDASMTWNNEQDADSLLAWLTGAATETRGGIYSLVGSDVEVTLHAVADRGHLEVLSRPVVLASNNETAIFTVGNQVPFIRDSRITDTGQTINTVEYESIGIILEVTPYIAPNGVVEMDVLPEISTMTGESIQISDVVIAPVFAERSAETHCVVKSGQTAMIGGLIQDQDIETIREVPFLGKIPFFGIPFRRTIKSTVKTELLILLHPTVVFSDQELLEATVNEYNKIDKTLNAQKDVFDFITNPMIAEEFGQKPFEQKLEHFDLDFLQQYIDARKKQEEAQQDMPTGYQQRMAEITAQRLLQEEAASKQQTQLDDKQQMDDALQVDDKLQVDTTDRRLTDERQQIDQQKTNDIQRNDDQRLTAKTQQEKIEQVQLEELKKELLAQLNNELGKNLVKEKK